MQGKRIFLGIIFISLVFITTIQLQADVIQESVTKTKFHGTLGIAMKIFGGNKPIHTITYYKGNIMRADMLSKKGKLESSEIIDLDNELFISLNHKKKKYSQMTFEEWRQQIKESMEQFQDMESGGTTETESESEMKWSMSYDVDKAGKEEVNGRNADKVIMTIKLESEGTTETDDGETEEYKGEMIITSSHWMVPELEGNDEIAAFNQKFIKKLGLDPEEGQMQNMWETIFASYPQLREAGEKMGNETEALSGTAIKIQTVYESQGDVKAKKEDEKDEIPTSLGGLAKGLGKKALSKDDSGPKTLMEMSTDILKQEVISVDANLLIIPEKYKLMKK